MDVILISASNSLLEAALCGWASNGKTCARLRRGVMVLVMTLAIASASVFGAVDQVWAEDLASAGMGKPPAAAATSLPNADVLGLRDVASYRQIFALQEKGQWKKADRLIDSLSDPSLMGHVLAQRYLHPTHYRSSYPELKDWMASYADHPEATRIYKLALSRRPQNYKYPDRPVRRTGGSISAQESIVRKQAPRAPRKYLKPADRRWVRTMSRQIKYQIRKGWTLAAKRNLESKRVKRTFPQVDYDRASVRLGSGYFAAGRDEWALEWLSPAAKRSGKYITDAHWWAGLAAWRLGDMEKAADHFETLASYDYMGDWMTSAANFWAARANLILRRPDRVARYLEAAAGRQKTFYGLLARRMLGKPLGFSWGVPGDARTQVDNIASQGSGFRALALMQVGQQSRAETEMRLLLASAQPDQVLGILTLAARAGLSSLAIRLHDQLYPGGEGLALAAYPVPSWEPKTGFRIDRALIFALIRQESRFDPRAKSYAGARGLMQLMPSTASFIARDSKYRKSRYPYLYQPELNLELGQKYIEHLFEEDKVEEDLFRMTAAWNGGPGNLRKWYREWKAKQKTSELEDPLIFLESIPLHETRNFVERVLTNLWIYRDRFGQPTPSLDAIAAGHWPEYIALDDKKVGVVD